MQTCFSDYDKYSLLQRKIIMNLQTAIQSLNSAAERDNQKRSIDLGDREELDKESNTPKRTRLELSSRGQRSYTPARRCLRLSDQERGTNVDVSPAVTVCNLIV